MFTDAVLYQSTMVDNAPFQQLSNLRLDGLCTIADSLNTDNGRLYGTFSFSAPNYTLNLYSDRTQLNLVATATSTALGVVNVVQANGSGLSGSVNFAQYAANDPLIQAVCFISTDDDLPLNNLDTLADFDDASGFAEFHILAFNKIKEVITSRYRSVLYNPSMIDTRQINGGLGGYDLSRVYDWTPLKEASYHYAFALLAERQAVEADSIFYKRAKDSKSIFKGYMESVEIPFDTQQKRVADKSRSGSTFKIGRA